MNFLHGMKLDSKDVHQESKKRAIIRSMGLKLTISHELELDSKDVH